MSSTRRAEPGKPLRQERYASSEEFTRGLNAYLVSRRCSVLDRPEDRDLIYFLQMISTRDGGFQKLAAEILTANTDKICTPSMVKFGMRPGQIYNAGQVKAVRREIADGEDSFLLKGENASTDIMCGRAHDVPSVIIDEHTSYRPGDEESLKIKAQSYPASYAAADFVATCQEAAQQQNLEKYFAEICLNPETQLNDGPWYFPELINSLRDYQDRWIAERQRRTVVTALGEKLNDALDYALESRRMVLIEGMARMGKTFGAKAWAEQHPGRARYVQVPSTNDDGGFYRAIAKALGLASGLSWKAVQLRERVEETLQSGDLLLILDEAHYLWPVSNSRFAFPSRITWIMTALVNQGVPVALISTPQFIKTQKVLEQRTHWTAEQFTGRIGHYEKLPDSLSETDLAKVARSLLPEGDAESIKLLTLYAQGSSKYLAGIEAIVCRARYLALKEKRDKVIFADLKRATKESVIPSDSALAQALALPVKGRKKTFLQPVNEPLTSDADVIKQPLPGPRRTTNFADRKPAETLAHNRSGSPLATPALMPA